MSTTYLLRGRNRSTTINKPNAASTPTRPGNKAKCLRCDPAEPQRHVIFVANTKLAAMPRTIPRVLAFDAERYPNRALWTVGTLIGHLVRQLGLIEGETLAKLQKTHVQRALLMKGAVDYNFNGRTRVIDTEN